MNIAILGTGMVGRTHAAKLSGMGHKVYMGTRDVDRKEQDPDFRSWHDENESVRLMTFDEAAEQGELAINALAGKAVPGVMNRIKSDLAGKIIIDITNALDFSSGTFFISNTDSLAEEIQKTVPGCKVVKSFNTLGAELHTNPVKLAGGEHTLFVSGDDPDAKEKVMGLARDYGWKHIIDLGSLITARAVELYILLWMRLWENLGTEMFNANIVLQD